MEVRVKIHGHDAIFNVETKQDAENMTAFFQSLPPQSTPEEADPVRATMPVAAGRVLPAVKAANWKLQPESQLRQALARMGGWKSEKVLRVIAEQDDGCKDSVIREKVPEAGENLGPAFAHISKTFKQNGIDISNVLQKKTRRFANGKIEYNYILSDQVRDMINGSDSFESLAD